MVTLIVDHGANRAASEPELPHTHAPAQRETAPSREPVSMPAVSVNGVPVSRKAIAAEVQNTPARTPAEGWTAATRALVIRELLLQEARRLDIEAEPKLDTAGRRETEEEALMRALLEREVRTPVADAAALQRFYGQNLRRFVSPPLWEVDHILCAARRDDPVTFAAAREKAGLLASELAAAPERFGALARAHSDCPSAAVGGSLGQIGPGDTTPEFQVALAALSAGQMSGPVDTRYGVHLIRMNRCIAGRQLPFEAVRERIAAYLEDHVTHAAHAQYVSLLVGRADIKGIVLGGADTPLVQ
ncbi:MAG: peptidylprolyl isomerase [Rhizobiales bacterium 12-68-15]|nr:MAG: peptidylprolyl isomerase [Rhizobiales bacterium 12-68-15]